MKKVFFAFCMIAVVCLAACKNNKLSAQDIIKEAAQSPNINVSDKEYIVDVPHGWRRVDTSLNGLKATILFAPVEDNETVGKPCINILNGKMSSFTLDDYTKENKTAMQSNVPSFKLLEQGDIQTSANIKGKWIRYSWNMGSYDIECIVYIFPIDNIAYELSASTQLGQMNKYKNDFDAIVKSFRLK